MWCKSQLVELNTKTKEFRKQGIEVAAITYDTLAVIKKFAKERNLNYPLLSDEGSVVIKAFGILNDRIAKPGHRYYGVPHPGIYMIDERGIIKSRFAEKSSSQRYTSANILARSFGTVKGAKVVSVDSEHIKVTSWATDSVVSGGNLTAIVVELQVPAGSYLIANGAAGEVVGLELKLTTPKEVKARAVEYPEAALVNLPPLKMKNVPAYTGALRILCNLSVGQAKEMKATLKGGKFEVKGTLTYQVCDKKLAYGPFTKDLNWEFSFR